MPFLLYMKLCEVGWTGNFGCLLVASLQVEYLQWWFDPPLVASLLENYPQPIHHHLVVVSHPTLLIVLNVSFYASLPLSPLLFSFLSLLVITLLQKILKLRFKNTVLLLVGWFFWWTFCFSCHSVRASKSSINVQDPNFRSKMSGL